MKYLVLTIAILLAMAAAPAQAQIQYEESYPSQAHAGRLSPQDQQQFDKFYAKWVDATRKGDQDDIQQNAQRMEEIMGRYNIPSNVPFAAIASNSGAYGNNPNPPYVNGAYGSYPAYGRRLSPGDEAKFDTYYQKWVDATRKDDKDDVRENAQHMEDMMARYDIPAGTPFQVIATNAYVAGPYPPNPAYAYAAAPPQRLSEKDQKDFDKAYKNWAKARHKKDMDDVDHNARKMEDIMAKYNIPANVPFDQIATPGAAYH